MNFLSYTPLISSQSNALANVITFISRLRETWSRALNERVNLFIHLSNEYVAARNRCEMRFERIHFWYIVATKETLRLNKFPFLSFVASFIFILMNSSLKVIAVYFCCQQYCTFDEKTRFERPALNCCRPNLDSTRMRRRTLLRFNS